MSKGKGLAAVLMSMSKPKDGGDGGDDKAAFETARADAAASILAALESRDASALGSALDSFMDVCAGKPVEPVED